MAITLEQIHEEIISVKEEMKELRECIHEDLLELSEESKQDIEASRIELQAGKGILLENIGKKPVD